MTERKEYVYHAEALAAHQNESVLAALEDTTWFTPEFIVEVHDNEPAPERENGCGPFKDKFLGDFLRFALNKGELSPSNAVFVGVTTFLTQRMVGPQGHPYPLDLIPFVDEEFMNFAISLGANESYEVSRDMTWAIQPLVKCLIAPPRIRRQVVRQICSWGEGYENVKRDTLLWAELVRRGAKSYLERSSPQF